MLEASDFHPGRSGREHLRSLALAAGIPFARVDEVLSPRRARRRRRRRVKGYSLGMRQRLGLASALLGEPELLVLDEPANGLDPEGMRWLRDFLRTFAASGGSVLVSSHVLAEVEQTVDRVVIINHGRFVAEAALAELTARVTSTVRVRSPQADRLAGLLTADGIAVTAAGDGLLSRLGHSRRARRRDRGCARRRPARARAGGDLARGGVPRAHAGRGGDAVVTRQIRSEVLKLRTTRTTFGLVLGLFGLVVFTVVIQLIATRVDSSSDFQLVTEDTQRSILQTAGLATLFSLLIGILAITSEFRHGTIRPTLLFTPARELVVGAKGIASAVAGGVLGLAAVVVTFAITLVWLQIEDVERAFSNGALLEMAAGIAGATLLWGVIGVGVGAIIRNQVGRDRRHDRLVTAPGPADPEPLSEGRQAPAERCERRVQRVERLAPALAGRGRARARALGGRVRRHRGAAHGASRRAMTVGDPSLFAAAEVERARAYHRPALPPLARPARDRPRRARPAGLHRGRRRVIRPVRRLAVVGADGRLHRSRAGADGAALDTDLVLVRVPPRARVGLLDPVCRRLGARPGEGARGRDRSHAASRWSGSSASHAGSHRGGLWRQPRSARRSSSLLSFVAPVVLEPLFNRFAPLADEELARSLRELSVRAGVPVSEVLVADASRRTRKQNAYVSGFGRTRRLVVFDTLVEDGDPDAVRLVLAHELGHRRAGHILKGTALGVAGTCVVVVLIWAVLQWQELLDALDVERPMGSSCRAVCAVVRDRRCSCSGRRSAPRSRGAGSGRPTGSRSSSPPTRAPSSG